MPVRIEKNGPVTTVIHSRREARNGMDSESADALAAAFIAFDADPAARVAVLWGEGGNFCAGWDLKLAHALSASAPDFEAYTDMLSIPDGDERPFPRGALGPTRLELTKPVIAAVAGAAVAGGMELACWADIRVMEEDAFMGIFCRRWGIPLLDGGTVRIPRLVGMGRAMEIILTGRKVPADECYRVGLCEKVVPRGEARPAAEALAADIARFPQSAVRADRRSAYAHFDMTVKHALRFEWRNGLEALKDGVVGAGRFVGGKGRHGDFGDF